MRKLLAVTALVMVLGAVLLAPTYLRYRRGAGAVPPWVRLGGVDVGGGAADEVADALNRQFAEPVALYYGDQRVILRPYEVGFQVDAQTLLSEARRHDTSNLLLAYLVSRALNRHMDPIELPLRYSVDQVALDKFLADVAARYDRPPSPPQPVLDTLTLAPGRPGRALDLVASREQVLDVLSDPRDRTAHLAVQETPAPPPGIEALGRLFEARLDDFPGIASVYLYHVPTGEEIAINADVAYAGMSTMKIAILAELYRKLDLGPGVETTKLITETISQSGNFTANLLLGVIAGDGSPDEGVRILNESLHRLGLTNTFMATPYDRKYKTPPRVVTEANSRTDLNSEPDPYMQTTPRDMGTMLAMLVECSEGKGALLAAYPDQYQPEECQEALDFMALNEVTELLVGGLPADAKAVHKHGYVPDTHGDVAVIWGPQGPYVLSVFLYSPGWLMWDLSNPTMQDLSRAAWNYFAGVATNESTPAAMEIPVPASD
jgi:beta-lactamase class A